MVDDAIARGRGLTALEGAGFIIDGADRARARIAAADRLRRAGYDPRAMSTVLQSLAQQNALEAQLRGTSNRVPEWASTHPDPASRVQAAASRASG